MNAQQSDPTILLVDDDTDFLFFAERAFRKNGVNSPIHTLKDGIEAINYIRGEGRFADRECYAYPAFIIIDLKMPKADGFSVLDHLKHNPEWSIVPTVILTGSADKDDVKKAYMLGASAYHVKPTSPDDLQRQLQLLIDYWTILRFCQKKTPSSSVRQTSTSR